MNEHLKEPLLNYKNQSNPGYALLITGEWGAGKTYTILNYFSENAVYYISLYGLSSEVDIHTNIFSAMHPKKNAIKTINKIFDDIHINALSLRLSPAKILAAIMNPPKNELIKKDKIIVFDDLERCKVDLNETLGAINKYVEHHGCRVIVICNDKNTSLALSKEKLFGMTLKVSPNIEEAFDSFTQQKKYKVIKEKFKNLILDIFRASEIKSLRILKHTINDCLLLYSVLEEKHKNNTSCLIELFSIFIAITYEVRSGKVVEADLKNRTDMLNQAFFARSKYHFQKIANRKTEQKIEEDIIKIDEISKKYISIPFQSKIISDNDLIEAVFNGNFRKESIKESINSTAYFTKEEDTPNWVKVYQFYELNDKSLEESVNGLKDEFLYRKKTISGEMLHLFHLQFMMAYFGETSFSYEEIEIQCKEYIDDLYEEGNIEPEDITFDPYRDNDSYAGYGYWTQDDYKENSTRVKKYLKEARKKSLSDQHPAIQKNIIDDLKNNIRKFTKNLGYQNGQPGEYLQVPILSGISPADFVDTWLSNPKNQWMSVVYCFQTRYQYGKLNDELADEKEWLKEVINIIEQRASMETGFKRFCLIRLASSDLKSLANA